MTIQGSSGALDSLLLQLLQQKTQADKTDNTAPVPAAVKPQRKLSPQDIVSLSGKKPPPLTQNQSILVEDTTKEVKNGYRRTQDFKNARGQEFTRIEEVTTTEDRTKRVIIQQNKSGSTTALESIFDRQDDGSFRLTQRYTDETGQTSTNISLGVTPANADILLGRPPVAPSNKEESPPFGNSRGTQFDVRV